MQYNHRLPTNVAFAIGSEEEVSALPRAGTDRGVGAAWLLFATIDPSPGFGTPDRKTFMAL